MSRQSPGARPALPGARPPCVAVAALGLILAGTIPALAQPQPSGRQQPRPEPAAASAPTPTPGDNRIVAVVNGEVVSRADVVNRARLFALNTGLNLPPEMLDRLGAQLTRLLIDERLRLQEVQRRRIPVSDRDVAEAVQRCREPQQPAPRRAAAAAGRGGDPTAGDVRPDPHADRLGASAAPATRPGGAALRRGGGGGDARRRARASASPNSWSPRSSSRSTIPRQEGETRRFVEEVIGQLRRGVPFPVVATQFSQAQTALQGGDLGWVRREELEDAVAR